jgi:type II secretory pathway component GspD/PulD (secretin)
VKRILGPFGDAVMFGQHIVLTDSASNLRRVIALLGEAAPPATTEVVPLTSLEPARVAELLRGMFGKTGAFVDVDPLRNGLVIRGSRAQIDDIKQTLHALGEGQAPAGGVRIIELDRGSAQTLAESLQEMMRHMRGNPLRVVVPGVPEPPGKTPPKPPAKSPLKGPAGKEPGLTDPSAPPKPAKDDRPGVKPVTITAFGQRVIVTSDDPEALALAQELARLLLQAGPGELQVIRLQHSQAVSVAKVIDELFNEPAGAGEPRRHPRVRVVADPQTNSLLLKAAPLELQTIRRLLRNHLDQADEAEPLLRVFLVGPLKHVAATDVSRVLSDLFKDAKHPGFSVTADGRNNTLVVRCTPAMHAEIEAVVRELDREQPKK